MKNAGTMGVPSNGLYEDHSWEKKRILRSEIQIEGKYQSKLFHSNSNWKGKYSINIPFRFHCRFLPPGTRTHIHNPSSSLSTWVCQGKVLHRKSSSKRMEIAIMLEMFEKGDRKWSSAKWEIYVLEEESGKKNIKNQQQQHSTYKCQNRYYVNISRHIIVCINTLSYINMMLWISYFIRFV